jgi:hypothetical protein
MTMSVISEEQRKSARSQFEKTKLKLAEMFAEAKLQPVAMFLLGDIEHLPKSAFALAIELIDDWRVRYALMKLYVIMEEMEMVEELCGIAKTQDVKTRSQNGSQETTAAKSAKTEQTDGRVSQSPATVQEKRGVAVRSV